MDSQFYKEIIESIIFPFSCQNFTQMKLHQDNDPKHTSTKCVESLNDLNIKWVSMSF